MSDDVSTARFDVSSLLSLDDIPAAAEVVGAASKVSRLLSTSASASPTPITAAAASTDATADLADDAAAFSRKLAALTRETTSFGRMVAELPTFKPLASRSEARRVFEGFDTDGSGCIDFPEVVLGLKALGIAVPESEARATFDSLDHDGSGKLELHEFSLLLERCELARQGRDTQQHLDFERHVAAVRALHAQAQTAPLEVVAEGEVPTLVRAAAGGHPAVLQLALSALSALAEAGLSCALQVGGAKELPAILTSLARPAAVAAAVQQGARLLAALLGDESAANEAKFRRKLRLSLADAALPMLVAAAGRPDVLHRHDRAGPWIAAALAGMAAEEELAGTFGTGGGAALRVCCELADSADADARLPAVSALSACAAVEANAAALVGFGAIQPLLMATAIPGAGKDHAREALRRLNKHELWRNSDAQRNHVGGEVKGEAMTPARRKKVVEVEELELLTDAEV